MNKDRNDLFASVMSFVLLISGWGLSLFLAYKINNFTPKPFGTDSLSGS